MRFWTSLVRPGTFSGKAIHEWLVSSKLAAFSLFLLSLLVGGYLFLPVQAINQRLTYEVERQSPLSVNLETMSVLPILTIKGQNLEVGLRETPQYRFRFSNVTIDPWWSSLFKGAPGLEGSAAGMGGDISFHLNSRGDMQVVGDGLQIDLPLQANLPLRLTAAGVDVRLESSFPFHLAEQHLLDFAADRLEISGLELLSPQAGNMSLGQVKIKAAGQQGVLKVEEVLASGGVLNVTGSGEILIAANLPNSRINLMLSLATTPQLPTDLGNLLELLGPRQPDGTYRLHLTGTLSRPVIK